MSNLALGFTMAMSTRQYLPPIDLSHGCFANKGFHLHAIRIVEMRRHRVGWQGLSLLDRLQLFGYRQVPISQRGIDCF